jgi:rRNA maturation endonuclease Nob1
MKVFCVNCRFKWQWFFNKPDKCPLCGGKRIIVDEKKHKQEEKSVDKIVN